MNSSKIRIEPNEIFFYLDKLIRKIKIINENEFSIKFELLTVLNDDNLSPLQANETQAIIESNQSFLINLEFKDSRDKNCDSIIVLVIYKVQKGSLIDSEPISEPIQVPFHYRKVNLINLDQSKLDEIFNKTSSNKDVTSENELPLSDNESIKLSSKDKKQDSPNSKLKKRTLFKKANKFDNIFKSNKTKEKWFDKFGRLTENYLYGKKEEGEANLKEFDKNDWKQDAKLEIKDQSKQEDKKLSKKDKRSISKDEDDLSVCDYEQINGLRYEGDRVRKLAKLIVLFSLVNFCYTIFLVLFNPLNQLWFELIDNFNLISISKKCSNSSWLELFNMTCFKTSKK